MAAGEFEQKNEKEDQIPDNNQHANDVDISSILDDFDAQFVDSNAIQNQSTQSGMFNNNRDFVSDSQPPSSTKYYVQCQKDDKQPYIDGLIQSMNEQGLFKKEYYKIRSYSTKKNEFYELNLLLKRRKINTYAP